MTTGQLIRAEREAQKMSIETLARALDVSEKTVRRWELGEHDVPSKAVGQIAQTLGISVAELYPQPDGEAVA